MDILLQRNLIVKMLILKKIVTSITFSCIVVVILGFMDYLQYRMSCLESHVFTEILLVSNELLKVIWNHLINPVLTIL